MSDKYKRYRERHPDRVKATQEKYNANPINKAKRKAHKLIPEVRLRMRELERLRRARPEFQEKQKETRKRYYAQPHNKERYKQQAKLHNQRRRSLVLSYYGKQCACCGETEQEFLGIDHINGCGKEMRKEQGFGSMFYCWLIRNNFPQGFQTLCHNCNLAKGFYGICPHKKLEVVNV